MKKRKQFRDEKRCTECGGSCCRIYRIAKDLGVLTKYDLQFWKKEFEYSGALTCGVVPFFDPVVVHTDKQDCDEQYWMAKGINPWSCQYRGKVSCRLPWECRPTVCKEFRCRKWIINEKQLEGEKNAS